MVHRSCVHPVRSWTLIFATGSFRDTRCPLSPVPNFDEFSSRCLTQIQISHKSYSIDLHVVPHLRTSETLDGPPLLFCPVFSSLLLLSYISLVSCISRNGFRSQSRG